MKQYTMHVCETCGYESKSFDDMEKHEANHLGLTVEELHEYAALRSFAEYISGVISHTNTTKTRAACYRAIADLENFQKEHHIE